MLHVQAGEFLDDVHREVRALEADGDAALFGDDGADADFLAAEAQAKGREEVPDGAWGVAVAVFEFFLNPLDVFLLTYRGELLVDEDALGFARAISVTLDLDLDL